MLVLTRKSNQSIMIGDEIEISVLSVMGDKVRIGIQAPRSIPVYRREVYAAIQREREDEVIAADPASGEHGTIPDRRARLGSMFLPSDHSDQRARVRMEGAVHEMGGDKRMKKMADQQQLHDGPYAGPQ